MTEFNGSPMNRKDLDNYLRATDKWKKAGINEEIIKNNKLVAEMAWYAIQKHYLQEKTNESI